MHASQKQPTSDDPVARAYEIAGFYADYDHPLRRAREILSERDIKWAWDQYATPDNPTSLRTLGTLLGVSAHKMSDIFRERFGFEHARMAERRSCCGDLFKQHRK
jgi:hypothetical protein